MDADGPIGRVVQTVLGVAVIAGAFVLGGGTSLGDRAATADISNVGNIVAAAADAAVAAVPATTTTTAAPVVTTTTVAPVEVAPVRTDLPILKATTPYDDDTGECVLELAASRCAQ